tara:strand:+ start:892 stop:1059 length:168 start_codon:yes stop_codon:yes gene_type:complete
MLRYIIKYIDGDSDEKTLSVEVQDRRELKEWLVLLEKLTQAKQIIKYERKAQIIE